MKVLLINPNYRNVYSYAGRKEMTPIFPPMGLAYIAAVLRENNADVEILDSNALDLSMDQIRDKIISFNPDFIGLTSTTCMIQEVGKIVRIAKQASKAKIIVGGVHPSSLPEETLKEFSDIDIVMRGEGEYVMLDVIKGKALSEIKGISFIQDGKIIHNEGAGFITDLDALPFPARDLLPRENYFSAGTRRSPSDYILSSRGCPYGCNFCADHLVHGKKFRARSAKSVLDEINMLVDVYQVREIDFIDDNFTMIFDRVEEICDGMIKQGLNKNLIWRCSNGVRVDRLTFDLLKKMKEAGCYMLSFGVESGNEEILKKMKKGIKLEQVKQAVRWAEKLGIETRGLYMFGNLGENEQTMLDTIKFAKELNTDTATFHITIPFPRTEYWDIIKKEGQLFVQEWSDYIAYGKVIFQHGDLDPDLLVRMQKKAFQEYYFRFRFILKKLLSLRSWHNVKMCFKGFFALLRMKK